jgi:hypothetical protein
MKLKFLLYLITLTSSSLLFGQANRSTIIKEFAVTKDDSVFITKHSIEAYKKYSIQRTMGLNIFSPLDSLIFFNGAKGKVIGPLNFNDQIVYIKLTAIDSSFRMRVGNIWLSPEKRGQENIGKLADEILKTVIRTNDFDAMRKEYSDDLNERYEADLGWIFQGVMVNEFEIEVLKHKKGDYYIVDSRFGKHVVKTIDDPVLDRSKVEYALLFFNK